MESYVGGETEDGSPALTTWTVVNFVEKSCKGGKKKSYPAVLQRSLYFTDVAGHHVDRCTMSSHPSVLSETGVSACYPAVKHLIAISLSKTGSFPWQATWARVLSFYSGVIFKDTALWRLRKYHRHCCFNFRWVLLRFETVWMKGRLVLEKEVAQSATDFFFYNYHYSFCFPFSLEGSCFLSLVVDSFLFDS